MTTYTLKRTGQNPLQFDGELIGSGGPEADFQFPLSERGHPTGQITKFHRVEIYRTKGGKWIVAILFRSAWPSEPEFHMAEVADSPEGVQGIIDDYRENDLENNYIGPPEGTENAMKNGARLWAAYANQFDKAATDALSSLQPEVID